MKLKTAVSSRSDIISPFLRLLLFGSSNMHISQFVLPLLSCQSAVYTLKWHVGGEGGGSGMLVALLCCRKKHHGQVLQRKYTQESYSKPQTLIWFTLPETYGIALGTIKEEKENHTWSLLYEPRATEKTDYDITTHALFIYYTEMQTT